LIILDIDYFKKVNATYGHIVGDEILKFLTKNVQTVLRDSDIFARYCGEEFVILLPDTDLNNALLVAQKIRSLVEETPYIDLNFSLNVTVSIDVKQFKNERLLRELHNADKALYKAKENGRNMLKS